MILTEEPSIDSVLIAINNIYGNHSSTESNSDLLSQSSLFLSSIQASSFGWKVSDSLLSLKRDVNSYYFAAQTMRVKISKNFKDIQHSIEMKTSLRLSLFNHLIEVGQGTHENNSQLKSINRQLCLSIAFLSVLDSDWIDPFSDLLNHQLITLEDKLRIIGFIGEEFAVNETRYSSRTRHEEEEESRDNRRLLHQISAERRHFLRDVYFKSSSPALYIFFHSILAANSSSSKAMLFRAFSSWISLLFPSKSQCETKELLEVTQKSWPLFSSALHSLLILCSGSEDNKKNNSEEEQDAAADVICSFVSILFSRICHFFKKKHEPNEHELTKVMNDVILQILPLESTFNSMTEEIDVCINVLRILTETADSSLDSLLFLLSKSEEDNLLLQSIQSLIQTIFNCISSHFDVEVIEVSFNFFHAFADQVYDLIGHQNEDEDREHETTRGTPRVKTFASQVFKYLFQVTKKHSRLESDLEAILEIDSDFREFRTRLTDLWMDCSFVDGVSRILEENVFQQQTKEETSKKCWTEIEVDLFFMSCLSSQLLKDESPSSRETLVKVMSHVSSLLMTPSLHLQIIDTCCSLICNLHFFVTKSEEGRVFLEIIVNLLVKFVTQVPSASSALSLIVTDLTEEDNNQQQQQQQQQLSTVNLLSILVQVCLFIPDSVSKDEESAVNVLSSTAKLISSLDSSEEQDAIVISILDKQVNQLNDKKENQEDICLILDRISSFLRNLSLKSKKTSSSLIISSFVSQNFWPLLSSLMIKYSSFSSTKFLEKTTKATRFMIRSLTLTTPVVKSLIETTTNIYSSFPSNSCLLYLASILVDEYSSKEEQETSLMLLNMLHLMSTTTFSFLTAKEDGIRTHPDTIDDFFRLCVR